MTYLEPEPDRKKEKKTPTLEELKTKAEKAADEWFAKHAADLKVLVHKRLEKSFEEIFLAALGLKKGWGSREWEVDRMNGRSSVISGELDARACDLARTWFDELLQNPPTLSEEKKRAIRNELIREANSHLQGLVYDYGHELAEQIAKGVFEERSS